MNWSIHYLFQFKMHGELMFIIQNKRWILRDIASKIKSTNHTWSNVIKCTSRWKFIFWCYDTQVCLKKDQNLCLTYHLIHSPHNFVAVLTCLYFLKKKKFVRQSHVCVYIYTNMWICICVCVSVYVDIYIISYLYVGVYSVACIYICVYMNIYVCVCVYMCLHLDHVIYIWKCVQRMYVGVCSVATRILVYIYVYICIHIYKYQHTYKLHFVALLTCLCFLFLL